MDIQAFRVFVAVAREGSQTRAAQQLHLTQPAVGLQIKGLQEEAGLELFTRTPQGMSLTPNGAILLLLAEKVLEAQQEFKAAAIRMNSEVRGSLAIGTILDPEFTRLGAFLNALLEFGHHIEIKLSHGMSGDVVAKILRGELDVGFYLDSPVLSGVDQEKLPASPPDELHHSAVLETRRLTNFTYRVVAPVGWGPQVLGRDWKALASLPWLATPPASIHHRLLVRVFGPGSSTGISPKWVAMVDQEASMLDLVKSGAGLSLVREQIALREAQAHGLVIADRVSLDCALSFVCMKTRVDHPVVATALAAIDKVWRMR
ncbi:LysR family transcriptional regulator [Glaciimonas sp. PCH181]|uniref:LysR family transcriptional regulator n=1 Tax=Glaciimonas sp. PCH181 TaxID=2133943 RepID=UPI000D36FF54|nr:LysR family transcriptional regulator [Glaciimonas sp. PCH181]PUA18433.1 LysR family transcriptional regulator [Glaciimonas sp. PCH181]